MRNDTPFFLTKLTVLALVAVLAGCGGGEGGGSDQNQSATQPPEKAGGGNSGGDKNEVGQSGGEQSGGLSEEEIEINQVKSAHNARMLATGLSSYFDGKLKMPPADKWCDAILEEVGILAVFYSPQHPDTPKLKESLPKPTGGVADRAEPAPPAPTEPPPPGKGPEVKPLPKGDRVSHYALNKSMAGGGFSGSKVLVFECDLGWNGSGGLEDALKYMEKYKLEKIGIANGQGQAKAVTAEELKTFEWE